MDRLSLHAQERKILGKKVKKLRLVGQLPAHVFGRGTEGENVLIPLKEFLRIFKLAGETTVIDLKIGQERIRPVLIREVQYDPIKGEAIHVDFYQVDLTKKVKVPVPLVLVGEQPELIHLGEAIVLQTLNEVEVEALPTDLIEKIEVDITSLVQIDDAITVGQLQFDRSKLTLSAQEDEIVVKLAPAVTAEMEKLLEEQAAETAAAAAEIEAGAQVVEGTAPAEVVEGGAEGEAPAEGVEQAAEGAEKSTEEQKPQE